MITNPQIRVPWWIVLIMLILVFPAFSFPEMLSRLDMTSDAAQTLRTLVWLYPLVMIVYAICAWLTWSSRRTISVLLLVMMLLTDAAIISVTLF